VELRQAAWRKRPWKDTAVTPGQPSDPYLMTNYDRKSLTLCTLQKSRSPFPSRSISSGTWREYAKLTAKPGEKLQHEFPSGYSEVSALHHRQGGECLRDPACE
jgi:hypothetical protein